MRGVNGDSGKEKTVVEEHRSNFSKRKRGLSAVFSKRPKSSSWTHKFICLATTGQERVPAPVMKEDLLLAGLGEKNSLASHFSVDTVDARKHFAK